MPPPLNPFLKIRISKIRKTSPLTNVINKTTTAILAKAQPTTTEMREVGEMIFEEFDNTSKKTWRHPLEKY